MYVLPPTYVNQFSRDDEQSSHELAHSVQLNRTFKAAHKTMRRLSSVVFIAMLFYEKKVAIFVGSF